MGGYRFDKYLTDERSARAGLSAMLLRPPAGGDAAELERAVARARSTARAVARARGLVNEPAGVMTPTRLAGIAAEWGQGAAAAGLNRQRSGAVRRSNDRG